MVRALGLKINSGKSIRGEGLGGFWSQWTAMSYAILVGTSLPFEIWKIKILKFPSAGTLPTVISECWNRSKRRFTTSKTIWIAFDITKKVFHQKLGSRMDAPIFVFNQVYSMRSEPNFDLPKTNFDLPNANFDLPKPKFKLRNTNFKMRDTNFNPLKSICAPPTPLTMLRKAVSQCWNASDVDFRVRQRDSCRLHAINWSYIVI